jgi:site-specific recombinase XerD
MGRIRSVNKVKNVSELLISGVSWEEAFQMFMGWKRAQNVSQRSLDKYDEQVKLFFKKYPDAFRTDDLQSNIYEYMAIPAKPSYYNHKVVYLGCFFKWCIAENMLKENPLQNFRTKPTDDKIIDVDDQVLRQLLALPDHRTFAGFRDYALLCLSLDTGIRPGEASQLNRGDINFEALEVYVRSDVSKTRVKRTLPIITDTAKAIRKLIAFHHPAWGEHCPIFCTSEGTPLNDGTWGIRVRSYGDQLGVHLTPYSLRHIFALHYLRNGGDALHLKRLLGHKTLLMTNKYVALTSIDLKQQHSIASPLNILLPQKHRMRKV